MFLEKNYKEMSILNSKINKIKSQYIHQNGIFLDIICADIVLDKLFF